MAADNRDNFKLISLTGGGRRKAEGGRRKAESGRMRAEG
jgi:hypothetical protein